MRDSESIPLSLSIVVSSAVTAHPIGEGQRQRARVRVGIVRGAGATRRPPPPLSFGALAGADVMRGVGAAG